MATLAQIYEGLTGRPASGSGGGRGVTPWVMDSRLVRTGGGFVARPGATAGSEDGHRYIPDALRRGASVVIADRARVTARPDGVQVIDLAAPGEGTLTSPLLFLADDSMAAVQRLAAWWRSLADPALRVIGVTGSVGKTTVKELVASVLSQRYRTFRSRGNYNSDIGLPMTLLDMPLDAERVVVELGMTRAGEIAELAAIARPHVGIVTNVGAAHMMQLGSLEAIAAAKAELVQALPPDGLAILNGDDARVAAMAALSRAPVWSYGLHDGLTIWADQIESHGLDGISLRLHQGQEQIAARLPLLGRHSVHAALAAAAAGRSQGQNWGEIVAGLKALGEQEVLRVVVVEGVNGSTLIDDSYNASPDSMMAALNLLQDLGGRRIAVLGEMLELGPYEAKGHALVARRAALVAALFVAVGSRAEEMVQEAQRAGMAAANTFAAADREAALPWLRDRLQAGDMVLVKGSRALRLDELVTDLAAPEGGQ